MPPIEPGSSLSHYRIVDKIGEGGMGVVWRAIDTNLDREVALKILPSDLATDPERLQRFERESKTVAALNHPNIVTIYSVENSDEARFITMELIEGKQLDAEIPQRGMNLDRFLDVAVDISDAVAVAHQRGITHRDLKPANIMLDADGRPKILDFGLAKRIEHGPGDVADAPTMELTQAGKLLGTVPYMSPEQVKGESIDHRSDIFSLGTIFYEMATGKKPFSGSNSADMISSILRDRPDSISETNPRVPPQLDKVLSRSLEKDPEQRYQSAAEFRQDLDTLRRSMVSGEISLSGLHADIPQDPGRRKLALGAVLVGVVALAALAVLWPRGDAARSVSPRSPLSAMPAGLASTPSIAVLPFVNMSGDPENDYFSDGMTEELINGLSGIDGLNVAARTSVFALKGRNMTVSEIGEELGVDKVLEGSVRMQGDQLRVRATLIDVSDNFQMWTDTFDRTIEDLFAIQEEISQAIVSNLQLELIDEANMARGGTESMKAHDLYLQGRYAWNKRTEDGLIAAIDLFERAIEEDPDYARAYAGLADAYNVLPNYSDADEEESLRLATEWANRALEIEPELPEAMTSLAAVAADRGDHEEAARLYERAIRINPNYSNAHHWYGLFQLQFGEQDAAVRHLAKAEELDPVSHVIKRSLARALQMSGRDELAIEKMLAIRRLAPGYPINRELAEIFYANRDFERCIESYELLRAEDRLRYNDYETLAGCHHYLEQYDRELAVAREARENYRQRWGAVRMEAQALAGLGRGTEAIQVVRDAFDDGMQIDSIGALELFYVLQELRLQGHPEQSRELAQIMLDWRAGLPPAAAEQAPMLDVLMSYVWSVVGEISKANRLFEEAAAKVLGDDDLLPREVYLGVSGASAAMDGHLDKARQRESEIAELEAQTYDGYAQFWRAAIVANLGPDEHRRAVALIREAFENGYDQFEDVLRMPFFEPLYDDSGFRQLLRDLNLPMPG